MLVTVFVILIADQSIRAKLRDAESKEKTMNPATERGAAIRMKQGGRV